MTITLPARYAAQPDETSLSSYARDLLEFLSSDHVKSIFQHHPNWVVVHGPQPEWDSWWTWAAQEPDRWKLIAQGSNDVPFALKSVLSEASLLAIPRESRDWPMDALRDGNGVLPVGMSPKKAHEVRRMSAFVAEAVRSSRPETCRVVDVGAGQGYLSRALAGKPHGFDVLALDSSDVQTHGARAQEAKIERRRAKRKKNDADDDTVTASGTLMHKLVHVTSQSLDDAVAEWVTVEHPAVHFVALHACGGLTPIILRRFVDQWRETRGLVSVPAWNATGMTIVGCCYHLMNLTKDFPLSSTVAKLNLVSKLDLSVQHLHLAAQCPAHWNSTTEAWKNTELSVTKIVYRALLVRLLPDEFQPHRDGMPNAPRLGRLNDSAYETWSTFLENAAPRMGFDATALPATIEEGETMLWARQVAVLHILRCMLGPVVESLILLDRYIYLLENIPDASVDMVNLFDQASGSARNVALAVRS